MMLLYDAFKMTSWPDLYCGSSFQLFWWQYGDDDDDDDAFKEMRWPDCGLSFQFGWQCGQDDNALWW